ncbi:MAG: prephenate/arogenate dehydrogenase family protein [Rhodospirillaceae bacterium]|jgi:cyclohexadieny/prephenate dehydrogenase|nr:prephenate/arogenate dehydrogenase family protein [Rhodospirillaceae bacterium]
MTTLFEKVTIVGIGHIGSSIARVIKRDKLSDLIVALDSNLDHCVKAIELGIVDVANDNFVEAINDSDLIVLATPIGTYSDLITKIAPYLKTGTIVSDVGSVKTSVLRDVIPLLPKDVNFVPGHPIAGTENSGPTSGFAELFQGHWCILTPPFGTSEIAIEKIIALWESAGSMVKIMRADHHDIVLATISHLPHLIAYAIVGTVLDFETVLNQEVIKFSASGFRDFTRIAASDPIMWRDVFLNNKDAVLKILQRFIDNLSTLQKEISLGDGDNLEAYFRQTRTALRSITNIEID